MELIPVVNQLRTATERLSESTKEVFRLAKERAETEREYRQALSKEITRLRAESMQATLVSDVARGNVSELKFKRDLAKEMHRSAMRAISALEVEIQSWQSILRNLDEV